MNQQYVWYACYGSNLKRERFIQRYVNECTDKTPPREDRPYILHHQMYFAGVSGTWERQGVAFVDTRHDAGVHTLGRAFMITVDQLGEIQQKEGSGDRWYGNKLDLGMLEGHKVYTLTRHEEYNAASPRLPCAAYAQVIKEGLEQTYPTLDSDAYLEKIYSHTMKLMQEM